MATTLLIYRKKEENNEFLDKKQRICWLENTISAIENELMDMKVSSPEYRSGLLDRSDLLRELSKLSPKEYGVTGNYEFK